jgi:predicted P-loop ATPase
MPIEVTPNTDESVEFLKTWPTDFVHLVAIHIDAETGEKGRIEAMAFVKDEAGLIDWAAVRQWIEERQGKANLYFTVNALMRPPLDEKGRHKKAMKSDIGTVVALHVDIDVPAGEDQEGTATALIDKVTRYKPMPSVVIASGGGVQGFWLLEPGARVPIDGDTDKAEAVERYTRGLEDAFTAERGAKADRCHNVDRIMRLPGTINVPDRKKQDKGRKPALARLAAVTQREYALTDFQAAPPKDMVQTTSSGTATQTWSAGNRKTIRVDWKAAEDIWNTIDIPDLEKRGVGRGAILSLQASDLAALHQQLVAEELRSDADGPYPSWSEVSMAVVTALLRAGLTPEETAVVVCSKKFPGNHHQTKETNRNKLRREVERTIGKALGDLEANNARARATAAGVPIWASTYDKAGLHPRHEVDNVEIALCALGFEARLDLFHDRVIIAYGGEERTLQEAVGGALDDRAETALCTHIRKAFGFDPGDALLHRTILQMATGRAFDPVRDYLDLVQPTWDGVKRIDTWVCRYLGVQDTPLNREIGKRHLIAAVRRARVPGCKYDCICVLEGPEGGQKSTTIEVLAGKENFSDQTILGVSDREAQELLCGVWHFECADLSGMARAEIERTKAFASRTVDRARKAYGRTVAEQPRRCVIWATTNDSHYLLSQTGNRRFLPLLVGTIDMGALREDRDQLWAEAAVLEAAGEAITLPEALWGDARAAQEERRAVDPWEATCASMPLKVTTHDGVGRQEHRVIWASKDGEYELVATATVLEHVLRIPPGQQSTAHAKRLLVAMEKAGWERGPCGMVFIGGCSVRGYRRKVDETRRSSAAAEGEGAGTSGVGPATPEAQKALIPF